MTPSEPDFPPHCALIEVHVSDLKQIFNSLDPTPFRERDIDPRAEEFIAGWAREIPADKPLGLLIHVDKEDAPADRIANVRDAVREYFSVALPARPDEPGDWARVPRGIDGAWQFRGRNAARHTLCRCRAREPADRRLGRDVAAARGVPVRLVAYSRRSKALRSLEHNDSSNRAIALIVT